MKRNKRSYEYEIDGQLYLNIEFKGNDAFFYADANAEEEQEIAKVKESKLTPIEKSEISYLLKEKIIEEKVFIEMTEKNKSTEEMIAKAEERIKELEKIINKKYIKNLNSDDFNTLLALTEDKLKYCRKELNKYIANNKNNEKLEFIIYYAKEILTLKEIYKKIAQ